MRNKVKKPEFEYEEEVRDFTGLVFHCPNCDEVFHLHIATVRVEESQKSTKKSSNTDLKS